MLLDSNSIIYAAQPDHEELRRLIASQATSVSAISVVEVLGYHRLSEAERTHFEEFFRIINNAGRPFLYSADLFSLVDAREPADRVTEFGDDGERYSYPPLLNKPGFFEDFVDQKAKAVATFWRVVNHRLAAASKVA